MPSLYKVVKRTKESLVKKARKNGLRENFGQREVAEIKEEFKYSNKVYSLKPLDKEVCEMIERLDEWCMNYDGGVM